MFPCEYDQMHITLITMLRNSICLLCTVLSIVALLSNLIHVLEN